MGKMAVQCKTDCGGGGGGGNVMVLPTGCPHSVGL